MRRPLEPQLPTRAPDPAREAALAEGRRRYVYDFSDRGLCFLESLPREEAFGPRYLAKALEVQVELKANRAAATARRGAGAVYGAIEQRLGHEPTAEDRWAAWRSQIVSLPTPICLSGGADWAADWCFAWQRIAGPNPVLIRRLERLPAWLPFDDEAIARAVGRPGSTRTGWLEAGRLFVVDFAELDGLPGGETDGRAKQVYAPVAVFASGAEVPGGLAPVGIQTGGHRGDRSTWVEPGDGERWQLARTIVQAMDETHQGVVTHVGWCHMVAERAIVSAHRCLAPAHPIALFLERHFENTLAVNDVARKSVLSVGGTQDRLLAPRIDAQVEHLIARVDALDYGSLDPATDFARRGVGDPRTLEHYPFRDDGLPLFAPLRRLVEAYLRLYYADDAAVAADAELAAWVRDIGAADGGRLPRLLAGARTDSIDGAAELLSRLVYRLTVYHAAINDSSWDWVGFAPNMPCAPFAPLPAPGAPIAERGREAMLPTPELCWEVIEATYNVAALHVNGLLDDVADRFADARVAPLFEDFRRACLAAEADTRARDATRPCPYPYLHASRITASING